MSESTAVPDEAGWFRRLAISSGYLLLVAGATAVICIALVTLGRVVLPLLLALILATFLAPVAVTVQRWGAAPGVSAFVSILVLLAILAGTAWITLHAVASQWSEITIRITAAADELAGVLDDRLESETGSQVVDELSGAVTRLGQILATGLIEVVPAVATAAGTVGLSLFVAFFYVRDGEWMWRWIVREVARGSDLVDRIGRESWQTLRAFMRGQTTIALIDAAAIGTGAAVLGVPNAAAIVVLTFFGGYVPFIGATVAGALAVLLAVSDEGLGTGAWMLMVVLAVQQFEGNVLQPIVQRRAVRIHPLVVGLAVVAGGAIGGLLGVFVAVPLAGAVAVTLTELRRSGVTGRSEPASLATSGDEPVTSA